MEETDETNKRTPPSGANLLFVNQSGELRQKDSTGTVSVPGGTAPSDASFVTVNSEGELSDERTLSTGTGLGLTDAGAGNSLTVDADTLRGEPFVTTAAASSLSGETVAGVLSDVYGSPVQVGSGTDLDIDVGNALRDDTGQDRLSVESDRTRMRDDAGNPVFQALSGSLTRLSAFNGQPVEIFDSQASAVAVQYDTDTSAGTLSLPNATLDAENGIENSTGPVEVLSGNDLRLATGQAIEDGSGQSRFILKSGNTQIKNERGDRVFQAVGGRYTRLEANSGQPVRIRDDSGAFTALKYTTSSSAPGTLELQNAGLELFGEGADSGIEWQSSTVGGGATNPAIFVDSNGEIQARDSNGNVSQLT